MGDAQEALPGEVEPHTGIKEFFIAVLDLVAPPFGPIKRMDPLQPAALLRIKIHFSKGPPGGEAGAIVEGRIHLKISSVVLNLVAPGIPARVVAVGDL